MSEFVIAVSVLVSLAGILSVVYIFLLGVSGLRDDQIEEMMKRLEDKEKKLEERNK